MIRIYIELIFLKIKLFFLFILLKVQIINIMIINFKQLIFNHFTIILIHKRKREERFMKIKRKRKVKNIID